MQSHQFGRFARDALPHRCAFIREALNELNQTACKVTAVFLVRRWKFAREKQCWQYCDS